MKILISFLAIILCLSFGGVVPNAFATGGAVKVPEPSPRNVFNSAVIEVLGTTSQNVGSQFSVPVNLLTNGQKVCSVRADLSFDASKLQITGMTAGSAYPVVVVKKYSNANGTVNFTAGVAGCASQDANLYTLNFQAKATGNASIKFATTDVENVDQNGMPQQLGVVLSGAVIAAVQAPAKKPQAVLTILHKII